MHRFILACVTAHLTFVLSEQGKLSALVIRMGLHICAHICLHTSAEQLMKKERECV
jgi:hypothetical protein